MILQCYKRLYGQRYFTLNNSGSKFLIVGMDPKNIFDLSIQLKDPKSNNFCIEMSLETAIRFIKDVQDIVENNSIVEGSIFTSNVRIRKCDNNLFQLEQYIGIAQLRKIIIHKSSLKNFVNMKNILLYLAVKFDKLADKYIEYIRKYVGEGHAVLTNYKGDMNVKPDPLCVLTRALEEKKITDDDEMQFVTDTLINFQNFFLSFF